ncbi:MAG: glycosyltransferase family 2 protein [Clostridia bacterium]|nr:glycosyltransferase family 2 protein [Clostridia bacterium]
MSLAKALLPKVSIIIPCYNMEDYLGETLDSVLSQTYRDFEVVIIDDGSTDQTLKICQLYKERDSRVKVYSQPNGGVSAARNTGIDKATGQYILFLDGDDLIRKDLLENAFKAFNSLPIDMFSYGFKIVSGKNRQIIRSYSTKRYDKNIFSGQEFLKLYLRKEISQRMGSFLIKREILLENAIRFKEGIKYAEDQDFQLRCMAKCTSIYYTAEDYFYYVKRTGSAVNRQVKPCRVKELETLVRLEEELKDQVDPSLVRNYTCMHFAYLFKEVIFKGADRDFLVKYLEKDHLLNEFSR